jgi:hypothetical protein
MLGLGRGDARLSALSLTFALGRTHEGGKLVGDAMQGDSASESE